MRRGETRWLCQVTGTAAFPATETGLRGTDLGVSFPWGDRLCFLFGDSWTEDPADPGNHKHDSLAFGPRKRPSPGEPLKLAWLIDRPGRFRALEVKGLSLGIMEVPVEGIHLKDRTYVFFDSGWDPERQLHTVSALAHFEDPAGSEVRLDYKVPSAKFINISAEAVDEGKGGDPWIYLFGTGPFRKSAIHLARVRASEIVNRGSYKYYAGMSETGPLFVPGEDRAVPLFDATGVGELSVARHPDLKCWLMTYNHRVPAGVHLRWAPAPQGPWSDPIRIFKPWKDKGYTYFIHAKRSFTGYDDGLSDPGREEEWGGYYGPYLIPSYFYSPGRAHHVLLYTLSSWNPYQVHLMETHLFTPDYEDPGVLGDETSGPRSSGLENRDFSRGDLSGWTSEGDEFLLIRNDRNEYLVTSYDEKSGGGGKVGSLWQSFEVDRTMKMLEFDLYGGHGSVKLFEGRAMLRCTFGPMRRNIPLRACWNLAPFAGREVRLVIEDRHTDAWGYVSVGGFRIERE